MMMKTAQPVCAPTGRCVELGEQSGARRGWSPSGSSSANRELLESAKRLCRESLKREPGVAPAPSCALDPLDPPLSHFEYEDLERDTAKYFLYYAAIKAACRQLQGDGGASLPDDMPQPPPLRILVLGAGHGRLVTLSLEAAREASQGTWPFSVEVLDANPEACTEKYSCSVYGVQELGH